MVLITGGAGYIGSHVAKQLLEQGKDKVSPNRWTENR